MLRQRRLQKRACLVDASTLEQRLDLLHHVFRRRGLQAAIP
jgi:hypothetical protein